MSQIKVEYITHCGDDISTVNAARVSFDKESYWEEEPVVWDAGGKVSIDGDYKLSAKDEKLINYLAKHNHLSPFGHAFISLRVTAPVFVSRQLVKHKFLRINEVSRRYVDAEPEFFTPEDWRGKAQDKKQGSSDALPEDIQDIVQFAVDTHHEACLKKYNTLLELGVAPEQARIVLPQSMMTSWYWSGSLDAFAAMANLRLKPDAQAETREVAEKVEDIIRPLFPVSWDALRAYE